MYFLSNIPEIQLNPTAIFNIGPVVVTNSMIALWLCMLIVVAVSYYIKKTAKLRPTKLQIVAESIIEFFYEKLETAFGSEKEARRYLPYILTIFIMFLVANQFSVLPIINSMNSGAAPLFKTPTGDFSLPIAVALLTIVIANMVALSISPLKHIGSYIKLGELLKIRSLKDIPNAFLEIFLGFLDIIGEIAKVVSLSARLFGNVIAGELMVIIITYLASFTNFIVPIPFIFLSIFSGLIQAFVFPLLAVQYIAGSINNVREAN